MKTAGNIYSILRHAFNKMPKQLGSHDPKAKRLRSLGVKQLGRELPETKPLAALRVLMTDETRAAGDVKNCWRN